MPEQPQSGNVEVGSGWESDESCIVPATQRPDFPSSRFAVLPSPGKPEDELLCDPFPPEGGVEHCVKQKVGWESAGMETECPNPESPGAEGLQTDSPREELDGLISSWDPAFEQHVPSQVAHAPDAKMHRRYVQRLDTYLQEAAKAPRAFELAVLRRRHKAFARSVLKDGCNAVRLQIAELENTLRSAAW
mmetsp:Transcript_43080/g.100362  ORF Transcript_43080/g.100362 Transcript_43080/m.100362 type:complete len:190 (+) Transcript_43080:31-600(+)